MPSTTRFVALIALTCLLSALPSSATAQEYKGSLFPSDEMIAALPWQPPDYRPARILGKQKLASDEYRLVYMLNSVEVYEMTVIRLDSGLWYHPRALGLKAGMFTELKKKQ